uniref:F-box domain-containing protein n=1 Tax=Steinernema glaseri TaxID=37863 RepID=A0A1I8ADR5_9BILA
MDTVPRLFIESVCLCLLDHRSIRESTKLPSSWGEICTATCQKIHTLFVYLDGSSERIYAAAEPVQTCKPALDYTTYSNVTSLDSVDPKFITNFQIETNTRLIIPSSAWKEITLSDLQRLVHFIRPVRNERHPLHCDSESLNTLTLTHESQWINGQLLSLQLPVDCVTLWVDEEANKFFETAGPLYYLKYYEGPTLKRSAIDALIDKFVPIDGGDFHVRQRLSETQLKKLFEKCALANKEVSVSFMPEMLNYSKIFDSTGPIDYDK